MYREKDLYRGQTFIRIYVKYGKYNKLNKKLVRNITYEIFIKKYD